MKLLFCKEFSPFFLGQFLGALNDNIFRIGFSTIITYYASVLGILNNPSYAYILSGLFILPFLTLSNICGQISDKFPKNKVIVWVKQFEIAIMLLAIIGFWQHSFYILLFCIFLLGVHSTLLGPVKYSYLPEHFAKHELIEPNALVEMSTFIAILLGSILGTGLAKYSYDIQFIPLIGICCLVLSVLGFICAKYVKGKPASDESLNIKFSIFSLENIKIVYKSKVLWLSTLAISWLWFVGVIFLNSFFAYTKDIIHGNETILTILLAIFSIGIGIGSMLCERLSKRYIEWGLVPIGAIGMSIFMCDLYFATNSITEAYQLKARNSLDINHLIGLSEFLQSPKNWRVLFDFLAISFFSGIFSVPLYATMQAYSPEKYRSRVIAVNNIMNSLFMIISSLLGGLWLSYLGFSLKSLYLFLAGLNFLVVIYIIHTIPTFFLRCIMWVTTHFFYRVDIKGLESIPLEKPAVLACNHVSFMDAIIIGGVVKRPIRFVMDANIANTSLAKYIFKLADVIPISSGFENKEVLIKAYDKIEEALKNNELVCIFPEGGITRDGEINKLKSGILKIINRTPVDTIPIAISGMWGSFFSRVEGKACVKPFRRGTFNKIGFSVGDTISPANLNLDDLQSKIVELRTDK
ncbi:MAG: hypothetical protein RLZZ210_1154 [Pseudomonadota bacterium]|jgi:1-acyl-sn-glycerol-3-phosphate acyltransferase